MSVASRSRESLLLLKRKKGELEALGPDSLCAVLAVKLTLRTASDTVPNAVDSHPAFDDLLVTGPMLLQRLNQHSRYVLARILDGH
jgi:hypothetical protein